MQVQGRPMRAIWEDGEAVAVIDQTRLPFALVVARLARLEDAARAIATMQVRGAPLIGATAAYGMALAARADASDAALHEAAATLEATRPTAVNLRHATQTMLAALRAVPEPARAAAAWRTARDYAEADVAVNERIGRHGVALIRALAERLRRPVNILTHCNAGWLATVDWGTATAPLYAAQREGLALHVFVDETRPRNQGASLTAWELREQSVPHTVIVDNAGGHLMQQGGIDLCIVGADRVARNGDVANKIGTYLKALAAQDNAVPFYVALPSSTFDAALAHGSLIPIEERDAREVTHLAGRAADGRVQEVQLTPDETPARNWGFDVTPHRLVTGYITEHGVHRAADELDAATKATP